MATHRLGFPADIHYEPDHGVSTFEADVDHLYNTLGCDSLVWGGDNVGNAGESDQVPHNTESQIRGFWESIESAAGTAALEDSWAVPGNHDAPWTQWERLSNEYIGDRVETPWEFQPVDGITVLGISTQGNSSVLGGTSGTGTSQNYVPLRELMWLRDRLDEAASRGDVTILAMHVPPYFAESSDSNILASHRQVPFGTIHQTFMEQNQHNYWVCHNHYQITRMLLNKTPAVVLTGHDRHAVGLNGGSAETYHNVQGEGLYLTFQDHYDSATTSDRRLAYVDIDTSTGNVKFVTVDMATGSTTTVMNVTPSW